MTAYDSWEYLLYRQFNKIEREDMKVNFFIERDMRAARDIARTDGIQRVEPIAEWPVEARNGWRKKTIVLTGFRQGDKLKCLLDASDNRIELPRDGLALAEYLADQLGIRVGDRLGRGARRRLPAHRRGGSRSSFHGGGLEPLLHEAHGRSAACFREDRGGGCLLRRSPACRPGTGAEMR